MSLSVRGRVSAVASAAVVGAGLLVAGTAPAAARALPPWTATLAPLPSGSPASWISDLGAVSCPAARSCVAVGHDSPDKLDGQNAVIETLSGGTWTATAAPLPADGYPDADLDAVACPAAGSCVAVGEYHVGSSGEEGVVGDQQGLIETLSGGTWTAQEAPLPADAGSQTAVKLDHLSCPAAGTCVAVSDYDDTGGEAQLVIDSLSDGTWTATEAPLPADAVTGPVGVPFFFSVSCPAAGTCAAVGDYATSTTGGAGLIDTLAAGTWTATEAPLPTGTAAGAHQLTVLTGVDCPGTGSCVAVGTSGDGSTMQGVIETLAGGTWTAAAPPAVAGLSSVSLSDVRCPAAGSCLAVGDELDTLASGTWSAHGLAPPAHGKSPVTLSHVACPDTGACVATGTYESTRNRLQGLITSVVPGSPASTVAAPLPKGRNGRSALLATPACLAGGGCVVVGEFSRRGEPPEQGVIETPAPTP
jgi:hypothetical protein